jgi:L-threonylcarbamoyladenylate synthase
VFRPQAIRRIYRLKGRSYKKHFPFLVANVDQALALVEPPSKKLRHLLDKYWPGPLTVVFNTSALGRWTTGGKDTLALRIPAHPVTQAILKRNGPTPGGHQRQSIRPPEAVTGKEAEDLFGWARGCVGGRGAVPRRRAFHRDQRFQHPLWWTLVREGANKSRKKN